MEVCYKVGYRNFGGRLLGVVFVVIFLLFDKILEPSLVPATVEDFLYFPLLFSINKYRQRASL